MDNFIEEVDEELKRERQMELWHKYGKYAVSAVLLIVIVVAGGVGWRQYQVNARSESGLQYADAAALVVAGKSSEALKKFKALGKDGAAGYRDLARFQEAAQLAGQGNASAAAAVYDAIAKDNSVGALFRDLGLILYALNVADRAEPKALTERLKPLTEKTGPWRFSALEITALLHRRRGDVSGAKSVYKKLADDPTSPPRLRARAAEFLALLGK
jgi:hypothetical protein